MCSLSSCLGHELDIVFTSYPGWNAIMWPRFELDTNMQPRIRLNAKCR